MLLSFDTGEALAPEEPGGPVDDAGVEISSLSPFVTEHWFTQDAENRIRINNGKLENCQILVTTMADPGSGESFELLYDATRREVSRFRKVMQFRAQAWGHGQAYRRLTRGRGRTYKHFDTEVEEGKVARDARPIPMQGVCSPWRPGPQSALRTGTIG